VKEQLKGLEDMDRDLVRKVLSAKGADGSPVISETGLRHAEAAVKGGDPIEAAISVYRLYHTIPEDLRWSIKRRLPPLVRLAFEINDDIDMSAEQLERVMLHALELDVRGVAAVYDEIPRANKQRVIARLPAQVRRHARVFIELFDGISPDRKAKLVFGMLPPFVRETRAKILEETILENGGKLPISDPVQAEHAPVKPGSGSGSNGAESAAEAEASTQNPLAASGPGAAAPTAPGIEASALMSAGGGDIQGMVRMATRLRHTHRQFKASTEGTSGAGGGTGGGAALSMGAVAEVDVVVLPPSKQDARLASDAGRDLVQLRSVGSTTMEEAKSELLTTSMSAALWGQMRELGGWIGEGPCGVRVLCFLAGVFAMFAAFVGIFINFADAKKTNGRTIVFVIINGWIFWFALLITITEARTAVCGMFLRRLVEKYLPLFTTVSGRGHLLFFVGSLALSQWSRSQILNIVSGFILMTLGLANWIVSCCAAWHLGAIRSHVSSESDAADAFDAADLDGSGDLDTTELADLCVQLGSKLSHAELEAALMEMDKNRDRMISKAEFLAWWSGDLKSGGGWMSAMQSVAAGADMDDEEPNEETRLVGRSSAAKGRNGTGAAGTGGLGQNMLEGFSVEALAKQLKRSDDAREKRAARVLKAQQDKA